jgi:hypothetical protein
MADSLNNPCLIRGERIATGADTQAFDDTVKLRHGLPLFDTAILVMEFRRQRPFPGNGFNQCKSSPQSSPRRAVIMTLELGASLVQGILGSLNLSMDMDHPESDHGDDGDDQRKEKQCMRLAAPPFSHAFSEATISYSAQG